MPTNRAQAITAKHASNGMMPLKANKIITMTPISDSKPKLLISD